MAVTEIGTRAARQVDDLYREHSAEIYRYAYAMLGNRSDAEDVVQTTFMNALRGLERGEEPRNSSSWLVAIAHNVIRQRFRHAQARPAEVVLDTDVPVVAPEDDEPRLDDVLQALARIPDAQREALILREFEGRPYAEIAEILGTSTGALETLLFRARRSLAEELDNLVTCEFAENAVLRRTDHRLSRKERRRLAEHIKTCPDCARFEVLQRRQGRALKVLALLPIPASMTLFKGMTDSAAASTLPTIGAASAGTAAVATTGAGSGGLLGGLLGGGLAVKAATVAATVAVAGGVGVGTTVVKTRDDAPPPPVANEQAKQRAAAVSAVVAGQKAKNPDRQASTRATVKATGKPSTTKSQGATNRNANGGKALGKTTPPGAGRSENAKATGKPTSKPPVGKPATTKPRPEKAPATGKPETTGKSADAPAVGNGKAKASSAGTDTDPPATKTKPEAPGSQNASERGNKPE